MEAVTESPGESPAQTVAAYIAWMRSWGAAEKTIQARGTIAAEVLREVGIEGLTAEHLQERLARPNKRTGQPLSRWSRATYHSHLRELCAWLLASGRIAENPMENVRRPTKAKSLPRPLSEEEVDRALAAADGRTRDWIMLALLAGLRAHEIAKIRGEDVSIESIYVEGKGGVRASIPTHPDLWAIAQQYPRHGWWFPGRDGRSLSAHAVTVGVSELFDTLGIKGSVHRARHTYGTRLLRSGANVRVVQKLMRHANVETTAIYTAVDEDELRAAIGRL